VVNDSIILVEFAKLEHATGIPLTQAACKASKLRFRAVLLTSATTIVGMCPLLLESSPQAQMLIPLTTSIVFGLTISTLLVLFMVPTMYAIIEDFRRTARVDRGTHRRAGASTGNC
jgi:multidrug efflux pump subunit AcrB